MALGAGFFTPPPLAELLEVVAGATGLCTLYLELSAALYGSNCDGGCQHEFNPGEKPKAEESSPRITRPDTTRKS